MKAVQLMLVPEAACPCGKRRRRSRRYGVPYVGSKNRIAREIVDILPPAKHFYDLFAGGCAVAHAALESGKWETVHVNDIDPMGIDLFMGAVRGDYRNERRVIDRETFERLKGVDPYVRYCWSFGNNGRDYLWNVGTEDLKLSASRMIMSSTWPERMSLYRKFMAQFLKGGGVINRDLEGLERLHALLAQENADLASRIETTVLDYRDVPIESGSVVYCDIPYRSTTTCRRDLYGASFDHDAFYDWTETVPNVWISEYSMPEDRFECVWSRSRTCKYSATSNATKTVERLYRPRRRP